MEVDKDHIHLLVSSTNRNRMMRIKKKPAELLKSSGFLPFSIRRRLKQRGYNILCYGRPGCYIVKKNKMNANAKKLF